ncbi:hypothetical protein BD289DRAFT_444719 [Coniella lustricola]|uniref:SMODS and SLOG-associating 2TM effector domain-containing protein n=1 Tax=Coniella lustricola TaxID=2025994 RepID=A0A2T2ZVM1_9PEZI|nr:hypothetical protein BD289DRAFT_444719 [Coniella lustricola]
MSSSSSTGIDPKSTETSALLDHPSPPSGAHLSPTSTMQASFPPPSTSSSSQPLPTIQSSSLGVNNNNNNGSNNNNNNNDGGGGGGGGGGLSLTTDAFRRPSAGYVWATPAGLPLRQTDDESLLIFRRAVGINSDRTDGDDIVTIEHGRKHAVGIYRSVIRNQRNRQFTHHLLGVILYGCHFLQIVFAAFLTALGPNAKAHELLITVLGAVNTITAGVLAVLKGSGMLERLAKDEAEFKKLQAWIEETDSLLSVGVIGRNRMEVGTLVEVVFTKYNACFGREYEIMSSAAMQGSDQNPNFKNMGRK